MARFESTEDNDRYYGHVCVCVVEQDMAERRRIVDMVRNTLRGARVETARSVESCFRNAAERPPDIVILDPSSMSDPVLESSAVLDRGVVATILFGASATSDLALARTRRSVVGSVMKGDGLDALRGCLLAVVKGIAQIETYRQSIGAVLSTRERQALRAIGQGHTLKEAAAIMGVSLKSVETYKSRACKKLSLTRRSEVIDFLFGNNS